MQVGEGLGCLDESHLRVDEEWHGLDEEHLVGHEVCVKDGEQFPLGEGQRMVDVAGLGSSRTETPDVACAQFASEVADLVALAVVEYPGGVLAAHRERGGDGLADHREALAICGDEHVDSAFGALDEERPLGLRSSRPALEELAVGAVIVEVPGVARAREDRPHGQQCVEDEDRFGDDHEDVRDDVAAVRGIEQECRVHEDSECGQQHDQREHR